MMLIAPDLEPIQAVTTFVLLALFAVEVAQIWQRPKDFLWSLPILFLACHGILFYVFLTIDRHSDMPIEISYTRWSATLRLHGYTTILVMEMSRWLRHRKRQ